MSRVARNIEIDVIFIQKTPINRIMPQMNSFVALNFNPESSFSKKSSREGQWQSIALTFAPSKFEKNGTNLLAKNMEPFQERPAV